MDAIRYVQADTRAVKSGAGHGGARSMHMGGAAVVKAIDAALAKARQLAAHLLQASEGELVFAGGGFTVRGSERASTLPERGARERAAAVGEHVMNMTDVFTFPSGCHVAEVEVDPETGAASAGALHRGRRLRPADQPAADRGPGAGRRGAGHRPGDARAHRLRSRVGPAAERLADGLRPAARRRPAGLRHRAGRAADRRQSAGRQGLGAGGLHRGAPDRDGGASSMRCGRPACEPIDMPATPERIWRALQVVDRPTRRPTASASWPASCSCAARGSCSR